MASLSRLRRHDGWAKLLFAPIATLIMSPLAARAQGEGFDLRLSGVANRIDLAQAALPLSIALMVITVYAAAISLFHIRARRLWNDHFEEQNRGFRDLQGQVDRLGLFLVANKHFLIAWDGASGEPEFEGNPDIVVEGTEPRRVLNFGEWLPQGDARTLDRAVDRLRGEGVAFSQTFRTLRGDHIEVDGRPVAGRAVMALTLVTGERLALARLRDEKNALELAQSQLQRVVEAIPQPVWLRDRAGRLGWVNSAYVQAVDASAPDMVLSRQAEILDSAARAEIRAIQTEQGRYRGEVTAIFAGQRRKVDVIEVSGPEGGGGFALDVSESDALRQALERQMDAHVRTLDELPSAVAIFDAKQQLTYSNRAFRDLFALDAGYLSTRPANSELLDRLRANGRLPEEPDFRAWKGALLAHYAATETSEQGWSLPNGRSLRVVISPNPEGGVTYLFEDETERFTLATSYDRLKNMQWETLMALSEGVGVFGSDGCLELSNPAFSRLWGIDQAELQSGRHVEEIGRSCRICLGDTWRQVAEIVCSLSDARNDRRFAAATRDERMLEISTAPLPDGATLVTVSDVTDTIIAERRLREHNEALKQAARLRTDFIKSVSFELRSPLTSVVWLAQSLAEGIAGPLNPKQLVYARDLSAATDAVLALTSDILDLASIESGSIELKRTEVDLAKAIQEATEGLKDRLGDARIKLAINLANGITSMRADPVRLRHIIFNLLADAVAYSGQGDSVRLAVRKGEDGTIIEVSDAGKRQEGGEPIANSPEAQLLERENSLRFSLAKALVQLHGGTIQALQDERGGTLVTVTIPHA